MKRYVIFAGVNGAGKTTLYQTNSELFQMSRINIDEIVRESGSWKNMEDVFQAGRMAVKRINSYFEKGESFNQETTLCGHSILENIQKAKGNGYCVELYYIGIESPELAIERVEERVKNGGHGIPEEDIRRRYSESLQNLKKVLPLCDYAKVYDNSNAFRLIATYIDGKLIDVAKNIPKWAESTISVN